MNRFQIGDIAIPRMGGMYGGEGWSLNTYCLVTAIDGERLQCQYQAHYGCPWMVGRETTFAADHLYTEVEYRTKLQTRIEQLLTGK